MLLAAFVVKEIIDALSVFYSIIGATLLVPVVGGLFVPTASRRDALTSIASGMIVLLYFQFGTDRLGWHNPNLWGLTGSLAGFLGSLLVPGAGCPVPGCRVPGSDPTECRFCNIGPSRQRNLCALLESENEIRPRSRGNPLADALLLSAPWPDSRTFEKSLRGSLLTS